MGKSASKDSAIVLATYNLRVPCDKPPNDWASRRDRVRWMINKHHFDIFGVQEAVKQQVDDVIEGTSFAKVGGGRDDFKDKGEHSCIFYDTKRFECLGGGTFGLSEKPDVPGCRSWGSACTRIASWGKFRDRKSGKLFCYYNTHLDHVSEGRFPLRPLPRLRRTSILALAAWQPTVIRHRIPSRRFPPASRKNLIGYRSYARIICHFTSNSKPCVIVSSRSAHPPPYWHCWRGVFP